MAESVYNATAVREELDRVLELLPKCSLDRPELNPCVSFDAKGFAVYNSNGECVSWLLFPGFNLLPNAFLAVVYLGFMMYLFVGVSIAADVFMEGIESVISSKRTVKRFDPAQGRAVIKQIPVWNWAVANQSLMAVGTTSPSILLSVVESLNNIGKDVSGQLGPSVILGAAIFNVLVMVAVCTSAEANGSVKSIKAFRVWCVVAPFSLFAYIWLYIVYMVSTPDVVTPAEAYITLCLYFVEIILVYVAEREPWNRNKIRTNDTPMTDLEEARKEGLIDNSGNYLHPKAKPPHTTDFENDPQLMARASMILSRYRRPRSSRTVQLYQPDNDYVSVMLSRPSKIDKNVQKVFFKSAAYSFLLERGEARVTVQREYGRMELPLRLEYVTENGDAISGMDYEATEGAINFAPFEGTKAITIKLIRSPMPEPELSFFVHLKPVVANYPVEIVQDHVEVTVVSEMDPTVVGFELPFYEVTATDFVEVVVARRGGTDAETGVSYITEDLTAVAGTDYVPTTGTLKFERGEEQRRLTVPLLPRNTLDAHKAFKVILQDIQGTAILGPRNECVITICEPDYNAAPGAVWGRKDSFHESEIDMHHSYRADSKLDLARRMHQSLPPANIPVEDSSVDEPKPETYWQSVRSAYKLHFVNAYKVLAVDTSANAAPGMYEYVMAYASYTWKFILACVPPAKLGSGYLTILGAVGVIGGMMTLMEELGGLFGCVTGLSPFVTGITVIAVGTSLPDLFASRIAAKHYPDADMALLNIFGGNAAAIYVGLGVPWTIQATATAMKGQEFHTPAGDLGFSTMLYCIFVGFGLVLLMLRRKFAGGELGGTARGQALIASIFMGMWLLFLALSIARAYGVI